MLFSNQFSKLLLAWDEKENNRQMPWKGLKDPYKIWLSEIILQQTRVEQGLRYYNNFLKQFPDIQTLAQANEKQVFKLWEGLGYYSRCRNLIATARYVQNENAGQFPSTYEQIIRLKGIGPYTAAAIASFAFQLPHAVVDGNVMRVLSRIFSIEIPIDSLPGKRQYNKLANELLNKKDPGRYNQAIMDFGATVCKPVAPLCSTCPFNKKCCALAAGKVHKLPVKSKKPASKTRYFYFFVVEHRGSVAIRERTAKDIWRHLYEFPLIELNTPGNFKEAVTIAKNQGWMPATAEVEGTNTVYSQKLTHQTIKSIFIWLKAAKPPGLKGYQWVKMRELNGFAFPKTINEYLKTGSLFH